MYIPKNLLELDDFSQEMIRLCMQTCQERATQYDLFSKYYFFGSENGVSSFNKVLAHIDNVSAFIFAPGGTRLYVDLPTMGGSTPQLKQAAEAMEQMGDSASRELNLQWHGDGHDLLTMNLVTWALVYGSMIEKDLWQITPGGPSIEAYSVMPHNIGVLREDVDNLSRRQEVICHQFYYSADELWRRLKMLPNGRALWDRVTFLPAAEPVPMLNTLQTILQTSAQPLGAVPGGNLPVGQLGISPSGMFRPVITQPVARAYELWIWDDMEDDYRVVTTLDPNVTLYNEPNFYLPRTEHQSASHPFTKFTPWPVEGYFWGMSEVFPIMLLQAWHDERIADFRRLQKLQVKPAMAFSGSFSSIADEKMAAYWDAGSVTNENPGAKAERMVADMPSTILEEFRELDAYFREMSGLKSILQGEGVQGIRGEGHAQTLSKFAGARINKKALAIEQGLIDSVNVKLRLLRRYDKTHHFTESGLEFVMDQLHDSSTVKVDAHSHSPIFGGDMLEEATAALKVGAIDKADWLEMTHLPGKERLKSKARKRETEKQKLMQQLLQDPKVADGLRRQMAKGAVT